jgi:Domain of unknown function (DUF4440)
MDLLDRLVELEHEGWTALTRGEGGAYYREHLTDDALMAFPFGVLGRDEAIAAMESAPAWGRFELREPRAVALGEDRGVLVYHVDAQRPGDDPYSAVVSSTFVRTSAGWRLAFHQQSPPG